jgi:hypothetical protein
MRIDSIGNLLVGKTATGLANAGIEATASNILRTTKANSASAEFNRTGTDGDIAIFWKDTLPVGSIGTTGGNLHIDAERELQLRSDRGRTTQVYLGDGGSATESQFFPIQTNVDLGRTANGWRNLYLSGGAYLGGTAAANHLDDYEEGTYTADLYEDGGSTLDTVTGKYTKIGNICTVSVQSLGGTTGGAGDVRSNLPFAIDSSSYTSNVLAYSVANGGMLSVFGINNASYVKFVDTLGAIAPGNQMIGSDVSASSRVYFTLTYRTA